MKRYLFLLLFSSNIYAQSYCDNAQWNSQTRFDGPIGSPGNAGVVTYLGHNPTPSDNVGTYTFLTADSFKMEFAGEPRHVCNRTFEKNWSCKMGLWFRYRLSCEF